jgi:hypothetical protein
LLLGTVIGVSKNPAGSAGGQQIEAPASGSPATFGNYMTRAAVKLAASLLNLA